MCGRVNVIEAPLTQFVLAIIQQSTLPAPLQTHYNLAPTERLSVLLKDQQGWDLRPMRWWLVPHWASEPSTRYSMFNAKSETLASSRAYKDAFKSRRCIIPVSGYYEWRKEGSIKVPYYIQAEEDNGLALAGLWDRWQKGDRVIESCTVITAAAPSSMTHIHARIPVHFNREAIHQWLDPAVSAGELTTMLAPALQVPLVITPVSTYVNNARHKDPGCIEPTGPSQHISATVGDDQPCRP